MKYRIIKRLYTDGTVDFIVQMKILFFWIIATEHFAEYSNSCVYKTYSSDIYFINSKNMKKARVKSKTLVEIIK